MTIEQSKLVEENHNLIYGYIWRHLQGDIDRWYDILAIALCKAAIHFEPDKGKFSAFAIQCMRNEYLMELRKIDQECRKINFNTISLQDIMVEEGELSLSDMIPDPCTNVEEESITGVTIERLLLTLKDREKEVLSLSLEGLKQQEIADKLGITQSYVCRIIQGIKKKYNKLDSIV